MRLIVFAGPSLPSLDPAAARRIEMRPPARCGDITRCVGERPYAIGLIDGLFETCAAVWHKEIVYALANGVAVFGAASIGALRAAELAPFGMIGVGAIFRDYRDGVIEDDDEVAVLHGPKEVGFPQLTEAMVNVRATLAAAAAQGVLRAQDAAAIAEVAKSLFYKRRTWPRIAAMATGAGVEGATFGQLEAWRPDNHVDLKRRDAQQLVQIMLGLEARKAQRSTQPTLSRTTYWVAHAARFTLCHDPAPERPDAAKD